jgi:hypothetical protein
MIAPKTTITYQSFDPAPGYSWIFDAATVNDTVPVPLYCADDLAVYTIPGMIKNPRHRFVPDQIVKNQDTCELSATSWAVRFTRDHRGRWRKKLALVSFGSFARTQGVFWISATPAASRRMLKAACVDDLDLKARGLHKGAGTFAAIARTIHAANRRALTRLGS